MRRIPAVRFLTMMLAMTKNDFQGVMMIPLRDLVTNMKEQTMRKVVMFQGMIDGIREPSTGAIHWHIRKPNRQALLAKMNSPKQ